jgi:hypothetical protein
MHHHAYMHKPTFSAETINTEINIYDETCCIKLIMGITPSLGNFPFSTSKSNSSNALISPAFRRCSHRRVVDNPSCGYLFFLQEVFVFLYGLFGFDCLLPFVVVTCYVCCVGYLCLFISFLHVMVFTCFYVFL